MSTFAFEASVIVSVMVFESKKIEGLAELKPSLIVMKVIYITSVIDTILPPRA